MTNYQLLPDLSKDDFAALKADIEERGVIVPVELDEGGNVLDGHNRLRAWSELKAEGVTLPDYPRVVRGGMTEQQKRNHVRALNIIRRQLTKEQRADQWAAMRADGMTYQGIADATGVSDQNVINSVSKKLETQPSHVIGKDGKKYPATKKRKPPAAPAVSIFAGSDVTEQKAQNTVKKMAANGNNGASQSVQVTIFSHESKEYYTPPVYVEAAREVMGGIDLDPASCEAAQERVMARRYFTVADDGLTQQWAGRVWLNPPYSKTDGKSNQELWSTKLIAEYESGNVSEAVLLVKAALGYKWFEALWYDWPVCFVRERLSFIRSDGSNEGQSKQGTALLYLGSDVDTFGQVFSKFGRVILPKDGYKPLRQ